MKRVLALFTCATLALAAAHAGDIYRWVDEKGRVQLSDTVPEKFKKSAIRVDSRQYELTPQQRAEAEARAAREKARAAEAAARDAKRAGAAQAEEAAAAASAAKAPAAAKPAPPANDCATLRQRYRDNANCYAPFLNVNGTLKPGALEACGEPAPYPARECSSQPLR